MKIALIQRKAVPNDGKANLDLAVGYMEEAGRAGSDLVLFPEMWSIGYASPFPEAFDDSFQKEREKEREAWLSQAVGEDGNQAPTILMASEEEDILMAEFPMEEIREYRKNETCGNAYRKTGAYEKLLDPAVEEPFIREPLKKEKEER